MKNMTRLLLHTLAVTILLFATNSEATTLTIGKIANPVGSAPSLGVAASFAALAGTTVTNSGATNVNGDVGVSPGTAITGLTPGMVVGTIHAGDSVAAQAHTDTVAAYNDLAGQACDTILTGQDLGGLILTPGVYCFASSAQLTGILTLNALGDPNAVFVFQIGSTLTTASNSSVLLINSGNSCNVFFQVGSSATLGTDTAFQGNILALASITLTTRAGLQGRALAIDGGVTLDTNAITRTCGLGTTAASVSTSGRVVTSAGLGIRNAQVWMTDSNGIRSTAITSSLGYYTFTDVEAGALYILGVASRRYRFESRAVSASDSIADVDFIAGE